MSEETTNTGAAASERVGYCQDCGKPVTRETVRTVGTGVFCEPCLATRLGVTVSQPGSGSVSQPVPPPPAGAQPGTASPWTAGSAWGAGAPVSGAGFVPGAGLPPVNPPHLPNPTLAGLLGVIPGVGAMYNGQFAKGLIHFAIFAVLIVLQNDVSGVFGLFVAAWIIYQIFDAYHTAQARRAGLPLPNPFGLNELADRISQSWATQAAGTNPSTPPSAPPGYPPSPAAPASYSAPTPGPARQAAPGWSPAPTEPPVPPPPAYAPVGPAPAVNSSYGVPPANWAGYVHPSTFAAPSPPPPPGYVPFAAPSPAPTLADQIEAQALRDAGVPGYSDTFTGSPLAGSPSAPPVAPKRSFPAGALWLIALGVLVLVGNLSSEWRISGLWVLAGLFAALAVWTLLRRLEWAGGYAAVMGGEWPRLACMLRAPILLLTLSVLFLLQAAHVATFGQTWPVLPIAFGFALLLERTVGMTGTSSLPNTSVPAGSYPPPAYAGAPAPPAAAVPAEEPAETISTSAEGRQ